MADLMWSGGAEQFQDRYPYVWFVMGDWAKAPFYPTDPPRTPGAFYDSVAPIMDFPMLGTAYAPFISQYALYYDECWTASPPGTSTTTSNPPTSDDDTSLAAKVDTLSLQVAALHTKVGSLVETDTLASLAYYIASRVGSGEDPPPLASSLDTARILAALYYIAQSVIVPAWAVDNTEVLDAITTAKESIKGPHDTSTSSLWDAIFDAQWGAISAVNSHTDSALSDTDANVDAAETNILAALGDAPSGGGGNLYPGSSNITLGDPTVVTGPTILAGPMDGLLWIVNTVPNGQSAQPCAGRIRYKGLGWVAFMAEGDECEALQALQFNEGLLKPMHMMTATNAAIYCKSGSNITVRPYTINPA